MYNTPMFISAICKGTWRPAISIVDPQGITALVMVAVIIASKGPRTNKVLEDNVGIISSFINNFTPSAIGRSEEHTSELQSRLHLVCRLLLEKKRRQAQLGSS